MPWGSAGLEETRNCVCNTGRKSQGRIRRCFLSADISAIDKSGSCTLVEDRVKDIPGDNKAPFCDARHITARRDLAQQQTVGSGSRRGRSIVYALLAFVDSVRIGYPDASVGSGQYVQKNGAGRYDARLPSRGST